MPCWDVISGQTLYGGTRLLDRHWTRVNILCMYVFMYVYVYIYVHNRIHEMVYRAFVFATFRSPLALSHPLQRANLLVTQLQGERFCLCTFPHEPLARQPQYRRT